MSNIVTTFKNFVCDHRSYGTFTQAQCIGFDMLCTFCAKAVTLRERKEFEAQDLRRQREDWENRMRQKQRDEDWEKRRRRHYYY